MNLETDLFNTTSEKEFLAQALATFQFQYEHNAIYREFANLMKRTDPKSLEEIPFLPISFFKNKEVVCSGFPIEKIFKSSGTGGERSQHLVAKLSLYDRSCVSNYIRSIGNPSEQIILALLPNYLEQGDSSLVYMVDHLIRLSDSTQSAFLLHDDESLLLAYENGLQQGKQVVIFGVSYALLDLAEGKHNLSAAIVIETGGMKGRRPEITKQQLHATLKEGLRPKEIYSEYGMTELLSQAYCKTDLIFHSPSWMKILVRDTNDPLHYLSPGMTGGINVIDLANRYSCSFIATDDLGKINGNGFELAGRFDNADIRGCNLLVQ